MAVGGEIYCDSGDNIIIGNSKYSSSGSLLWTNELLTTPVFDSSNNIYCTAGNTIQEINSDGSNNWTTVSVDSTGRYNGNVDSSNQYLAYTMISGQKYLLAFDNKYGTTLNEETGYPQVSANYENSTTSIFTNEYIQSGKS